MAISSFATLPSARSFWISNARLPLALLDETVSYRETISALADPPFSENLVAADVEIRAGQVAAIAPPNSAPPEATTLEVAKGLIFPCFVDVHTHLDKTQTWNRSSNPDGTFDGALSTVIADSQRWSAEDLYHRMDFGLRCSYAHGTKAIRTHFDAFGAMAETALSVIQQLRHEWVERLTIQAVCLVSLDYFLTPEGETLADLVAENNAILGGVAYPNPDLDAQLDRVFTLAAERGLTLDFHVDESLNPTEMSLRHVAQAKLKHQFAAPVICSHCCTLSIQCPTEMTETLRWVKEAEIGIVSLPMCNLYLQDRQAHRMPRYRGVTVLHELKQQGIPVAISSDNCRDSFYAYGDYDGLEVLTQAVRIGHLDRPIADWTRTVTWTPADLMGLSESGRIGIGQPADLVLFKARSFNELLSRPQSDRIVMRKGREIDRNLPDYAELDELLGVS
ncbi:MAG: cytosine deaminase [Leptolyngbya sp. SIO1D8]|nr:cytosine deaminase [Leptolyngbya sp. SIO1D8]